MPHRPLLDFVKRIAATAYSPDVPTWIGMGVLGFTLRSHSDEPRRYASASITVTNHGLLQFGIWHTPSGRVLLKRQCEPIEADRVFASVLLRLKFDRDLIA
jgi:hypothetical protein